MTAAAGPGGRGRTPAWRKYPAAIVCAVSVGIVLLLLALPSPWGLGALEPNRLPVSIVSFQLNETPALGGPWLSLVVENSGSSTIAFLIASAEFYPHPINFPSVNETSLLAPGQSASAFASGTFFAVNATCGSVYTWQISGSYWGGSGFAFRIGTPLSCVGGSTISNR